jgi:hypothetical protein
MKRYILLIMMCVAILPGIAHAKIVKQMEITYGKKNLNVYSLKIKKYEINILQQKINSKDNDSLYKYSIKINDIKKLIYQESYKEYKIVEMCHVQLNKKDYLLVNEWTGGAHCCFFWHLYKIDDNRISKIIKMDLGNLGESYDDSIFELNNNLFIKKGDDRFAYFGTSFAGSFFFDNYFLIQSNRMVPAYKYFIKEYEENYKDSLSEYDNFIKDNEKQLSAGDDHLEEDLIVNSLALITYGYYTNKKDVFSILNKNKKIYDTYEIDLTQFYNKAINKLKK